MDCFNHVQHLFPEGLQEGLSDFPTTVQSPGRVGRSFGLGRCPGPNCFLRWAWHELKFQRGLTCLMVMFHLHVAGIRKKDSICRCASFGLYVHVTIGYSLKPGFKMCLFSHRWGLVHLHVYARVQPLNICLMFSNSEVGFDGNICSIWHVSFG